MNVNMLNVYYWYFYLTFLFSNFHSVFFFFFFPPACFLYSSFPSVLLISSCVTPDLLYLLRHWWWILSYCLLWMMLLWAYAWSFLHHLSEVKLWSDLACSKSLGFFFFIGDFIPILPQTEFQTEMTFLNNAPCPLPLAYSEVCLVLLSLRVQSHQGVKGSAGLAGVSLPAPVLSLPCSSFPVPGVTFCFEFLYLYSILTLSSPFISNTWRFLSFLWV